MKFLATLFCAAIMVGAPVQAQEEPEAKTGSRLQAEPEPMKTNPKSYNSDESRRIAKKFGNCLFERRKGQSINLLSVSDYWAIDYDNLGDAGHLLSNRILMEQCLGRVGRPGISGIGMRVSDIAIRSSLTEAAYLDVYGDMDDPITIDPDAPEFLPNRFYVEGPTLENARAAASMSDCVVYQAPAKAHAIVHTQPASREERAAIKDIVPALGNCIPAGKQMKLDIESIRAFVAEGLWARSYYGPKLNKSEGTN
ncbi:hypothetical protein ACI5KX_08465 [Erythrobacter sp. GH1-10]|uniref:hypothetical protein n=1 Tax=Erythrobacter sp. GH1-10 TaxID=3349334 RepID=UPI003877CE0B